MMYLDIKIIDFTPGMIKIPIFLYEKNSKKRSIAFYAGFEMTEEAFLEAKEQEEKGGLFQILYEMQDDFLDCYEFDLNYLKENNQDFYYMLNLVKQREERAKESLIEEFNFKTEFNNAFETQSFIRIIGHMRSEIALFDYTQSISQTSYLNTLFSFLNRDSLLNREACMCFYMAKLLNIKEEQTLLEMLLAVYLKDIGLTQIQRLNSYKEILKSNDMGKAAPYNIFMANKLPFDLPLLTKRILLEVYELHDGKGLPKRKSDEQIHILSQLVGVISFLFKFGEDFDVIAKKLYKENEIDGKKYIYHPEILKNLEYLFSNT